LQFRAVSPRIALYSLPIIYPNGAGMGSIYRSGRRWRAQVCVGGSRDSQSFVTKQLAAAWVMAREADLSGHTIAHKRLADAFARYASSVSPTHRGMRWEIVRLAKLQTYPFAMKRLDALTAADMAAWRDARLADVAPGTVRREMGLIRSVLEHARREWKWMRANPLQDVRRPREPPPRRRRITTDEIDRVCCALGVDGLSVRTASQRVGLAFLFALETAMRAGEILGLGWADVHLEERYVNLPRTKNGDARHVPLSSRAADILSALPRSEGPAFGLSGAARDALFRRGRDAAMIANLHFHDSRAEAIWRLSKILDVLQLARSVGHRDPKSLLLYYDESATDIAKRLD
jgi:integrase